jgi:glutaredoxin
MELTILTVPGCPHAPVLEERLATALADLSGVSLARRVITDEQDAARSGMRGSPTLLINGLDPFGDPAAPPGLSCRIYRDEDGRTEPVPSEVSGRAPVMVCRASSV